jgi:hypothetical protein
MTVGSGDWFGLLTAIMRSGNSCRTLRMPTIMGRVIAGRQIRDTPRKLLIRQESMGKNDAPAVLSRKTCLAHPIDSQPRHISRKSASTFAFLDRLNTTWDRAAASRRCGSFFAERYR